MAMMSSLRRCGPLVMVLLASGCCSDGDRGIEPPEGLEETASCLDAAADASRVVIAGRVFCDLEAFPVDPIAGDYRDDVVDGYSFDAAEFAAELDAAFTASGPRGYAWTLIQANRPPGSRVVASGSGGLAIAGRDAPGGEDIPFTPTTPSNIGSVTKLVAAFGLVSAHEQVVAALPPEERYSLAQLLNVPAFSLLPARWQHRYDTDNGLREVTIAQLLLHTSRLVGAASHPRVDDNIESLEHDVRYADLADNPLGYSNFNYRLLFPIIGVLLDPEGMRDVERRAADRCDDEFDDAYLRAAAVRTRDHLEKVVFAAVPGGMPATDCDPAQLGADWTARIAWAYRDDTDESGSYYNSFTTNPRYCSTTGGYYSSTDDLGALVHAYHNGLISAENRAILEGGTGMGWFVLSQPALLFRDTDLAALGIPSLLRKHGAQPIRDTDDVYRSSVYKLPYGHYLTLNVNSGYSDGSSHSSRTYELVDAFSQAFSLD